MPLCSMLNEIEVYISQKIIVTIIIIIICFWMSAGGTFDLDSIKFSVGIRVENDNMNIIWIVVTETCQQHANSLYFSNK